MHSEFIDIKFNTIWLLSWILNIPKIDGINVIKQFKKTDPLKFKIPTFICTQLSRVCCGWMQALDHLAKPFDFKFEPAFVSTEPNSLVFTRNR